MPNDLTNVSGYMIIITSGRRSYFFTALQLKTIYDVYIFLVYNLSVICVSI